MMAKTHGGRRISRLVGLNFNLLTQLLLDLSLLFPKNKISPMQLEKRQFVLHQATSPKLTSYLTPPTATPVSQSS